MALIACANNQPSKSDSRQVFSATTAASSEALSHALSHVGAAVPGPVTLTFSGPCDVGGSVDVAGSYDTSGSGQDAAFDLQTNFNACQDALGTLDGNLHWTSTEDATGFTSAMTGEIDWTDANSSASCVFDLHMSVTQTAVSYTGTVCGYDVTTELSGP